MAPDPAPAPPFAATVAGVRALIPEATIPDVLPAGRKGVITAQVTGWLTELSNRVDLRVAGWRRLRVDQNTAEAADGTPAPLDRFKGAARDVVHNGAASYTEAARYPERARVADSSYAGVLWERFETGLAELAAWVDTELTGDDVDTGVIEPGNDPDTPAGNFPPATRWGTARW